MQNFNERIKLLVNNFIDSLPSGEKISFSTIFRQLNDEERCRRLYGGSMPWDEMSLCKKRCI
jgi:hypothetical protein